MENRIIQAQMTAFLNSQQIEEKDPSKQFEMFASYCAVGQHYSDLYEISDIIVGKGGDCGIDSIAIIVNGKIITSQEEIDDIKKFYEIKFIFVQAKSSSNFDYGEIGTFGAGVKDFFSEKPQMDRNEQIKEKSSIVKYILDKATDFEKNPVCYLYYISTGKWVDDQNCTARINTAKKDLDNLSYFSQVEYEPVDADLLQKFYRNTTDNIETEINFKEKVSLPDIDNVKQSYLGFVDYNEYLKLITGENGEIRKSVFYDNVRDYQGENEVNQEIAETINNNTNKFVLFNNGVTVICKNIQPTGNKVILKNYQIVNGCQTSHVLFNNKEKVTNKSDLQIPIKIIETEDSETVNQIIKATNRQTQVKDEQLIALNNEFHRQLEDFYKTFEGVGRLYYERRSQQYNYDTDIEKVRIVSIDKQIKSVASMFYDKPHIASRYYGTLLKDTSIKAFDNQHKLLPYYTAAYTLYKLEYLFRNKIVPSLYRKFRFHILMMLKYRLVGSNVPQMNENRMDKICKTILDTVNDENKFRAVVKEMTSLINDKCDINSTEITKQGSLVEDLKIVSINK